MDRKSSQRFWAKVDRKDNIECWEWKGGVQSSGYGNFWINGKSYLAHRLAFARFKRKGKAPPTKLVRHKCNNRLCVNPNHLLSGTHKDNFNDAVAVGRSGAAVPKLKPSDIPMIRILSKSWPAEAVAKIFQVSKRCIEGVMNGETWKEVKARNVALQ